MRLNKNAHKNARIFKTKPEKQAPVLVSIDAFCAKIHADMAKIYTDMAKTPPPSVQLGLFFDSFPEGSNHDAE